MGFEIQRVAHLRELFNYALSLPEAHRAGFVDAADPQLRDELRELLYAQARGNFQAQSAPRPAQQAEAQQAPRIGPYRLVRELGRGGMGVVFLAVRDDGAFTKKVALKLILDCVQDPEVLARFRMERQVLAAFDHPNIARILDGGDTQTGSPYYVMEYIDGEPIDVYCERKGLDIDARLRLFQQVCHAVAYLHSKQVLHRDLKPNNILVTEDGIAKLLDFGIAKVLAPGSVDLTSGPMSPLTPAYASPEQLVGRTAVPASDVYSLGMIVYRLLTGQSPDRLDLKPPSASIPAQSTQLRRRLTGDLDMIVLKSLEQNPDRRYKSPDLFAADIQRFLENRTVMARPVRAPVRLARFVGRNRLRTAVAILLLLCVSAGVWLGVRSLLQRREIDEKEAQIQKLLNTIQPPPVIPNGSGPGPVQLVPDVRKLHETLDNVWLEAANLNPEQGRLRKAVLERSNEYLNSIRAVSEIDTNVAREVGFTYIRLGDLQQSKGQPQLADKRAAVNSYKLAAHHLALAAMAGPPDAALRGRIADVENRLSAMEASVPDELTKLTHPTPTPPDPKLEEKPIDRPGSSGKIKAKTENPIPVVLAPPPPPQPPPIAQPRAPAELLDRFATVSATVEAADQLFRKVKADLAAQNMAPRPGAVADVSRMKSLLDVAKTQIGRGDFTPAGETLKVADALAARVSREYGR